MSPEPVDAAPDRFDLGGEERLLLLAGRMGRLCEPGVEGLLSHNLDRPTQFVLDLRTYRDRRRGATRR